MDSNTPSQVDSKISSIPSLLTMELNVGFWTPFVKTSASCSLDAINRVQISPLSIFSLMKCLSISTCLVLLCCTRLWAMLTAALLSQYSLMGFSRLTCSFLNKPFIHMSSQMPRAMVWNSASTLDRTTTCFFLLLQVTKLSSTKVQYPKVDLSSIVEPAQFASV